MCLHGYECYAVEAGAENVGWLLMAIQLFAQPCVFVNEHKNKSENNRPMVKQAVESGVTLDTGNNSTDCKLQRLTSEGWQDYRENGELTLGPIDIGTLQPGHYRHVSVDAQSWN